MNESIYKVGKDLEAIDMFNKAMMKGPLNSEKKGRDFSLGLANRQGEYFANITKIIFQKNLFFTHIEEIYRNRQGKIRHKPVTVQFKN